MSDVLKAIEEIDAVSAAKAKIFVIDREISAAENRLATLRRNRRQVMNELRAALTPPLPGIDNPPDYAISNG